ncbi:MAG: hypothetical protein K6E85_07300 [Lachnospiraceae bacterium]|nr:hypothetical protein [Lachnospiraceae bacterium]
MSEKEYISRLFDRTVEFTLKSKGALVIVGPKWCGKSTTANRYARTVIDLMPLESRNRW